MRRISFYSILWAVILASGTFANSAVAQCSAPSYSETRYIYPYRAWIGLNMPGGASGSEAEAIPQGQSFSGVPNASGNASGLFFFDTLAPNTTYQWRARAICTAGGFSAWSAPYTFTTPPPCPPAPIAALDSVITLTFPTTVHPNIGYALCGQETEFSNGSFVWGFKATQTGLFRLRTLASTGLVFVNLSRSSGYHPECKGIYNCIIGDISPGYQYDFSLMAGDSLYFGFGFFPFGSANGSRTFVIEAQDCPTPTALQVDLITTTSARLKFSPGVPVDIEVLPENVPFTGQATHTNVKDSVTLSGLLPGTGYHWQIRGNCLPFNLGSWKAGLSFETQSLCDNIPVLQCDTTYQFLFKPGVGYYYAAEYAQDGREIRLRYRPERSDMMIATLDRPAPQGEFLLAWRDSAAMDCNLGAWPDYNKYGNVPHTTPLRYGEAGHTYYLLLDHAGYDTMTVSLNMHCPDLCPAPISLLLQDTQQTQVTLHWRNNNLSNHFEIEVQPLSDVFSGTPTHSGTGDTQLVTGLLADQEYHWRVRNICDGLPGTWSGASNFNTLPDCYATTIITCEQPTLVNSASGSDYIDPCNQFNSDDRYFLFTPPFDGDYTISVLSTGSIQEHFAYSLKLASLDCSSADWNCLGIIYHTEQLSTGLLEGGVAYRLAVERPNGGDASEYAQTFVIQCPSVTCLVADNLFVTDISAGKATLGWNKKGNEEHWDIELLPLGQAFSGAPNFIADTLKLVLNNLEPGIAYHWRIRNDCGSQGLTDWSPPFSFSTPPICQPIACGDSKTVAFVAGTGYFNVSIPCGGVPTGQDIVYTFTVDASNTTRYLVLPPGSHAGQFAFYLRNATGTNCDYQDVSWTCLGNGINAVVLVAENLVPGDPYYLLIKKKQSETLDTLTFQFNCTLDCETPGNLRTEMPDFQSVNARWDGGGGPWSYELDIRTLAGEAAGNILLDAYTNAVNLLSWINAGNTDLFEWRIRRICLTGDTSAWSAPQRFRLPFICEQAPLLACYQPQSISFAPAENYTMISGCDGWEQGQYNLYTLQLPFGMPTTFGLQITEANGELFTYTLSAGAQINCQQEPRPWPFCQKIDTPGFLSLGTLEPGKPYYLQVFHTGTSSASQTFQLVCACQAPIFGEGLLRENGEGDLRWSDTPGVADWALELTPLSSPFTGVPTHTSDQASLLVSGLDPSVEYHFRVRSVCTSALASGWSSSFPVYFKGECSNPISLACDSTISLYVDGGNGAFSYAPCGTICPGQEVYCKIDANLSGDYFFTTLSTSGNAAINIAPLSACDDLAIPFNCLGGLNGNGPLFYLASGQSYAFVADNLNLEHGIYALSLHCPGTVQPTNDEPFGGGVPPVYNFHAPVLPINGDCQAFTNRMATTGSMDPDPTMPPGNWYDVAEHSVWFQFVAPPGGTVRVNVNRDNADPMDPQVALLRFDSSGNWIFHVLTSGEDQGGATPQNAMLNYTGLTPGATYFLLVDGANGSVGSFCLSLSEEPLLSQTAGICETFIQPPPADIDTETWRNLYAANNLHINGPLLAAVKTTEDLGAISISTEILSDPPVLPSGQKMLPRYFNIEPEYAPQAPVQVRLFFTPEDLAAFNLTLPVSNAIPFDLSVTHYDGAEEDCDPTNNALVAGSLPVQPATALLVGSNGLFYLETTVSSFSELGATLDASIDTDAPWTEHFQLQVFPNPVMETLEIVLETNEPAALNLSLVNTTGQQVWAQAWTIPDNGFRRSISLRHLPAGTYQLLVKQEGHVLRRTLVVKI